MKTLYRVIILFLLSSLLVVKDAPAASPSPSVEIVLERIQGSELVIWEGPQRDGPSLHVPAPVLRAAAALQSQGLVFDVDWAGSWPAEAQTAFNYALGVWSLQLADSGVPVKVLATWKSMGVTGPLGTGGSTLGLCGSGCPYSNTYYPTALLDKFLGYDVFPDCYDISTSFNSDKAGDFYFGLDGAAVSPDLDFVTVVLHEVAHGLGFAGGMWVDAATCGQTNYYPCYCGGAGKGCLRYGLPYIYDQFTEDGLGVSLLNTAKYPNNSIQLAVALQSNGLYFDGILANAGNGGARVPIYVPTTWAPGSSYSHLNYTTYYGTENSLMAYMLTAGDSFHDPGPVTSGILLDIGWVMLHDHLVYLPLAIQE